MAYDPKSIEPRWQRYWEENGIFRTPDVSDKPKFYALDMFPYPSGAGLHVGHPEGYTATDIVARFKRMRGFCVLHPMGWDAFGLPAERAAVRDGIHPSIITKRNTDNFRAQIKRLGFSYDWEREIDTSSPDYYRWTQWIFLRLHERGTRLPGGGPGELVPGPRHGPGQRGGVPGRHLQGDRRSGRAPGHEAVDAQDHGLRPAATRRSG